MAPRQRRKKNANGEGGVYRRADGRWEAKAFVDKTHLTAAENASASTATPSGKLSTSSTSYAITSVEEFR
jgi:hypothetical protein